MLYLLTLMLVWVNTVAAPYHCVAAYTDETVSDMVVLETLSAKPQPKLIAEHHTVLQSPTSQGEISVHNACPAEESSVEETELSHRKDGQGVFLDEQGALYAVLPSYLAPTGLVEVFYPVCLSHNNEGHVALHKQPTYLLDCVFLI